MGKGVKVGHAGTLDPFATGLLVVGVGRHATKQLDGVMRQPKEYVAIGKLGELTDTLDATGSVIGERDARHVTRALFEQTLDAFDRSYEQVPPIYSALRLKGKRLCVLARIGKVAVKKLEKAVEKKRRTVHIHELELLSFDFPFFTLRAHVSHGTYVRVLLNDIAQRCNTHATVIELTRTAIGNFRVEDARTYDELTACAPEYVPQLFKKESEIVNCIR